MDAELQAALSARKQDNLYRYRRVLQSAQGPEVVVDGRPFTAFCSNDYLGLANHPSLVKAFRDAAEQYGVGSGAAHLVCGHSREHHLLEEALAEFTGRDRALLCSSGYMANVGTLNALLDKQDAVFQDRLNHASLLDGGLISGARFQRFLHNDLDNLTQRLRRSSARRKIIAVDSIFSMDGDCAPLIELAGLAEKEGAWLMADDAHGFGVLGQHGAGCAEHFNLTQKQLPILMGTLGKAVGTYGAFVAGSEALIETLIQFSRNYIYTTAIPPAVAAATRASLVLIENETWRREKLHALIAQFRLGAEHLGLNLIDSITPIQAVLVGDVGDTLKISQALESKGFLVGAIRPPTVAQGSSRLRITLGAEHSEDQVDALLTALEECKGLFAS